MRQRQLTSSQLSLLKLTCFHASFFPFYPFYWRPLFLSFSRHLSALFSSSKSVLFCRGRGTAQSSERGSFRMDLSTKFGKEIPSRNLRKKRSGRGKRALLQMLALESKWFEENEEERREELGKEGSGLPWPSSSLLHRRSREETYT